MYAKAGDGRWASAPTIKARLSPSPGGDHSPVYNPPIMAQLSVSYHRTRLLYVGFYLTLTGVAAAGLSDYFTDDRELRAFC